MNKEKTSQRRYQTANTNIKIRVCTTLLASSFSNNLLLTSTNQNRLFCHIYIYIDTSFILVCSFLIFHLHRIFLLIGVNGKQSSSCWAAINLPLFSCWVFSPNLVHINIRFIPHFSWLWIIAITIPRQINFTFMPFCWRICRNLAD